MPVFSVQPPKRGFLFTSLPIRCFIALVMSSDRHEWFLNQVFRYRPVLQRYLRKRLNAFCRAVDSLPPVCRRACVLRKVYRLSQVEIGAVLGVSENTVEKHVAKGLVRCRDYLRAHGLLGETDRHGREKGRQR